MAIKQNSKNSIIGASKDALFYLYLLLSAGVLIFILWPTLAILKESIFFNGSFSFEHYRNLFTTNRSLLKNSLFVGFWTTIIALFIGLCCALYVTHTSFKGKKLVLMVLLLTLISPPFVSSLAYIMLFGRRGLITWKILKLHWNPYGAHGIIMMESIGLATIAAFLIIAVLKGIDRSLEQASLDLGASKWSTLWHITLPLARPGIVTAALIVFIRSLSDFGTPMFIGGNYNVLATQAYMTAIGTYNLPKASAISTLLVIPAFIVFLIYRKIMAGTPLFSKKTTATTHEECSLPSWVSTTIWIVTWSFILFELLKYTTIFSGALVKTWGVNFSFTLHHIQTLKLAKLGSLLRSIKYATVSALAAGIMGIALAWFLGRKKGPFTHAIDFIADLPFILPGPFFGIAYLLAFNWMPEAVLGTGFLIVTNCVYRQLTLGVKSGISVLAQINPELEDAVRDQGGKGLHVFKDVIIPLLKPAFLVSFVNTFTFTMTTIGGIIFLITPYTKVATAEMFDAIQQGDIGVSSVMASVIILVVMIVNVSFSWFFLRKKSISVHKTEESYVPSIKAAQ
ncbi:iron ABC transporter permease [Aminobacterium sp. MB27-C1]|uniref:ABC transporter permease n=1 Tax=unclassified Aminobacterium TaxID=2685012 RepID=UPI0027DD66F0|nr:MULTISPECIES: iron ABC transporter permease [unclassified Aminobacterium]MEA4877048.1 iron ABC transporter permease [Aminobacterium sp.]WMI71405.1 iron ABC transporter permease [Aminobacterium sp. MB27-C1]